MDFSTEMFLRVYDDNSGDYIEIREDRDSLGLVSIVCGQSEDEILMTPEHAAEVVNALTRFLENKG